MTEVEYLIVSANKTFNFGFDVKQLVVKNSSEYTIYLNTSGAVPTSLTYEYSVQPHTDFTSSEISTRTISVYTDAISFSNPATLVLYSDKHSEAGNNPYINSQPINSINGFPKTITLAGTFVKQFSFTFAGFQTFAPVYFIIDSFVQAPCLLYIHNGTGDFASPIGAAHPSMGDGTIYYLPNKKSSFSNVYTLLLHSPLAGDFSIDVFYFSQLIVKTSQNRIRRFALAAAFSGTLTEYGYVAPPAFYYDLVVVTQTTGVLNYNFTLTVTIYDEFMGNEIVLINAVNYTGSVGAGLLASGRIIAPTLVINPEYRFMKVVLTNVASSDFIVKFNVWDYDG